MLYAKLSKMFLYNYIPKSLLCDKNIFIKYTNKKGTLSPPSLNNLYFSYRELFIYEETLNYTPFSVKYKVNYNNLTIWRIKLYKIGI